MKDIKTHDLSAKVAIGVRATATFDTRYSFTSQYLRAAKYFATLAAEIEVANGATLEDSAWMRHRAYVVGSVMQSSASLEAEIFEVVEHGPGHHLGSNGINVPARDFLRPLVDEIDSRPVLRRYEIVLHLLRRPPIPAGERVWHDASLLIRLRNELVHYKSQWGKEMEAKALFALLKGLGHKPPPWLGAGHSNFFPHQCVNADLAAWCPRAAGKFLLAFYERLGISSPVDHCRTELGI